MLEQKKLTELKLTKEINKPLLKIHYLKFGIACKMLFKSSISLYFVNYRQACQRTRLENHLCNLIILTAAAHIIQRFTVHGSRPTQEGV